MSELKIISTEGAPAAIGPYSQAILVDRWLWCSGQIALDPTTNEIVLGGTAEQAMRVLENLRAVLEAGGCSFSDVVKSTIYLADMGDFAVVNEIYGAAFRDHRPARATIQAAALPKGARVEIDCVARVPRAG